MLGGDVKTRGYDDYGGEVLASGIPIHQSAVRQLDVCDFDDFAKWTLFPRLHLVIALSLLLHCSI